MCEEDAGSQSLRGLGCSLEKQYVIREAIAETVGGSEVLGAYRSSGPGLTSGRATESLRTGRLGQRRSPVCRGCVEGW